ncbi:MAG: hypothetical protein R3F60_05460 [bacterium]
MRPTSVLIFAALAALLTACAGEEPGTFVDHETPEDFIVTKSQVPGIPGTFDRNHVMDDAFFAAPDAVTVAQVQAFLESTPYGRRCFLADETVNGRSAAQAIVEGSQSEGVNPVVMLARMQVEKSLIAKSSRPSQSSVDYAFGCGCPDGRACNSAYRGLDKQIACAARTLRRHYDGSAAGTSPWLKGVSKRTLDPLTVVPANHATASLYSYTPWVLEGRGGNWLVWNVTLKFGQHFQRVGADLRADAPGAAPAPANAWIGDVCASDDQCRFTGGRTGTCQRFGTFGMCTLSCEGLCPDAPGRGTTFCVDGDLFGEPDAGGLCARQPGVDNAFCAAIPGTQARSVSRHVGNSSASARTAQACVPVELDDPVADEPPPPAEAPPAESPAEPPPAAQPPAESPPRESAPSNDCGGLDFLGECRGDVAWWCDAGQLRSRDCGSEGLGCGFVDQNQGWYCLPAQAAPPPPAPEAGGCGDIDWFGECRGDVLVWCDGGRLQQVDCAASGSACGFESEQVGYTCL